MPSYLTCPACRKANAEDGRYCIHCGAILLPIYCSACGNKNPDGLEQCLECGSPMPRLSGLRWSPIVTVLNPTSAMTEVKEEAPTQTADEAPASWLRSKKFDRTKKQTKSADSSANNHT